MIVNHTNRDNPTLEAYLDGQLDDRARQTFETRLAVDPELRAEAARQAEINASLTRSFTPPVVPVPLAPTPIDSGEVVGDAAAESAGRIHASWPRRLAIAALLALSFGGLWWSASRVFPSGPGGHLPPVGTLSDVYRRAAHDSAPVDVQYASHQDYADSLTLRFHQRLIVNELPNEARILGMQFCQALSRCSVCIVVNVGDDRILLVADERDRARPLDAADHDSVNIFTREFDTMVLHELTPRDEPCLLGMFAVPELP